MTDSSRSTRLANYAVAAVSPMIAGSAAMADAVIVDITTRDATNNFTIDLAAAGSGGDYTFFNVGLSMIFYGRISATTQPDAQQFVATRFVGNSAVIDYNMVSFTGSSAALNQPATDTTQYLGFLVVVDEAVFRYGWIEYVNSGGSVTVSRWAYESNLNTAIRTPAASAPAVPGLGGLAALAMGAAGVRRNRGRVA